MSTFKIILFLAEPIENLNKSLSISNWLGRRPNVKLKTSFIANGKQTTSYVLRPTSYVLRPTSSVLRPPSSVLRTPSSVLRPSSLQHQPNRRRRTKYPLRCWWNGGATGRIIFDGLCPPWLMQLFCWRIEWAPPSFKWWLRHPVAEPSTCLIKLASHIID